MNLVYNKTCTYRFCKITREFAGIIATRYVYIPTIKKAFGSIDKWRENPETTKVFKKSCK